MPEQRCELKRRNGCGSRGTGRRPGTTRIDHLIGAVLLIPLWLVAPVVDAAASPAEPPGPTAGGESAAASRTSPAGPQSPDSKGPFGTRGTDPCIPPSGESIPAERILRDILQGKDVNLVGRVVDGSLDIDTLWPASDGRLSSTRVIPGAIGLQSCRITGRFAFPRAAFVRPLDLNCTEIGGDVDLSDSVLGGGLNAMRSRVGGQARLTGVTTGADLLLDLASVRDRLDLSGTRITGRLGLLDAEVGGDLEIDGALLGAADLDSSRFRGLARIHETLVLTDLDAEDSVFVTGLTLDSVRIAGETELSDAVSPAGFVFSDVSIAGSLQMALGSKSPFQATDLRVGGDLSLFDGRFGAVSLDGAVISGETEMDDARFTGNVVIRNTDFGTDFSADEARFESRCEMRRVKFADEDAFLGTHFAKTPLLVDITPPVLMAVDAATGGDEAAGAAGESAGDDDDWDDDWDEDP